MSRFDFQARCVRQALRDDSRVVLNVGCCTDGIIKPIDPDRVVNCDISPVDEAYDDPDDVTRVTSSKPNAVDLVFDAARDRWPLEDETVALVVLGDILEHMTRDDMLRALVEARRVSQRLCVTAPEDTRELCNAGWAARYRRGKVHQTVITESLLRGVLRSAGWRIVRWTPVADYDDSSRFWGKQVMGYYVQAE